jgi:hypothetical protein
MRTIAGRPSLCKSVLGNLLPLAKQRLLSSESLSQRTFSTPTRLCQICKCSHQMAPDTTTIQSTRFVICSAVSSDCRAQDSWHYVESCALEPGPKSVAKGVLPTPFYGCCARGDGMTSRTQPMEPCEDSMAETCICVVCTYPAQWITTGGLPCVCVGVAKF